MNFLRGFWPKKDGDEPSKDEQIANLTAALKQTYGNFQKVCNELYNTREQLIRTRYVLGARMVEQGDMEVQETPDPTPALKDTLYEWSKIKTVLVRNGEDYSSLTLVGTENAWQETLACQEEDLSKYPYGLGTKFPW